MTRTPDFYIRSRLQGVSEPAAQHLARRHVRKHSGESAVRPVAVGRGGVPKGYSSDADSVRNNPDGVIARRVSSSDLVAVADVLAIKDVLRRMIDPGNVAVHTVFNAERRELEVWVGEQDGNMGTQRSREDELVCADEAALAEAKIPPDEALFQRMVFQQVGERDIDKGVLGNIDTRDLLRSGVLTGHERVLQKSFFSLRQGNTLVWANFDHTVDDQIDKNRLIRELLDSLDVFAHLGFRFLIINQQVWKALGAKAMLRPTIKELLRTEKAEDLGLDPSIASWFSDAIYFRL